jgi:hypothetical protein
MERSLMARFRKKPVEVEVEVEAVQLTPLTVAECEKFVGGDMGMTPEGPVIATLEGAMHVSVGDWIICGVQGEFYPCKPDIFAATYEAV